jgi:hypothetical protein
MDDHWTELYRMLDTTLVKYRSLGSSKLIAALEAACKSLVDERRLIDPLFVLEARRGILERALHVAIAHKEDIDIVSGLYVERELLEYNDAVSRWLNVVEYVRFLKSLRRTGKAMRLLEDVLSEVEDLRVCCEESRKQIELEMQK